MQHTNSSIDLGMKVPIHTRDCSQPDPLFLRMCLDVSRMVAAWFNPSVPPSSALWSMYLDRKEDKQLIDM